MIRLYVDDLREPPEGWVLARTITEAIRLLAKQEISEVSLDYDIMHTIKPSHLNTLPIPSECCENLDIIKTYQINGAGLDLPVACPENFTAVAYYIAAMPKDKSPKVRIHTANPVGREEIKKILGE